VGGKGGVTDMMGANAGAALSGYGKTKQNQGYVQTALFDLDEIIRPNADLSSTFADNMKLPIHRWFRYSAGFSAKWVEKTITEILTNKKISNNDIANFTILDPFAGSGTTLLAAEQVGIKGFGFESHPLVAEVALAKLSWDTDVDSFRKFANKILEIIKTLTRNLDVYPPIVYKCYSSETLEMLDKLKYALKLSKDDSNEYKLSWLAFLSILRSTSHVGTAQWQYVLPNKTKKNVLSPIAAFRNQVELMCSDILQFSSLATCTRSSILRHDARASYETLANSVDLVITSPPYANNFDYADATRLELCVLGDINGWGDLQAYVRNSLIRSSSQHVSKDVSNTYDFLDEAVLAPIRDELHAVCKKLDSEKDKHGGKKNYHTMIVLYFLDLAKIWINLRSLCKKDSDVCFVIGDSAPYGIYVPVDEWLGKLAVAAGFDAYSFTKTRDRNVKWKNRKHRVPLQEGQLWITG
jgi:DNA modification methylase